MGIPSFIGSRRLQPQPPDALRAQAVRELMETLMTSPYSDADLK